MFLYILNIVITAIIWIVGALVLNKYLFRLDKKFVNLLFMCIISGLYFLEVLFVVVFKGVFWGYSPLANFSPLLFTLTFVAIFLPKDKQNKLFGFFAIFCPMMFVAAFVPSIVDIIKNSTSITLATYLDSLAHISFGLFTYYLLKSLQVSIDKTNLGYYVVNCLVVVIGIIIINLIWRTKFFGLVFFEETSIYNMTIFANPFVSNLVYICGLIVVLTLGYLFCKIVSNRAKGREFLLHESTKK